MTVETCTPCFVENSCKNLDFRPELARSHYKFLIESGKSNDEAIDTTSGILERDLRYLFWERFTKEKIVHFSYSFSGEQVLSPKYEVLGDVCDRFQSAIVERESKGQNAQRERVELEGFLKIKNKLKDSNEPVNFLLISPPPLPSELCNHPGYANYSFYYFGKFDPESSNVDMFAWRNTKTLAEQRDEANVLLGGEYFAEEVHPNDFLRNPIFIKSEIIEKFNEAVENMPDEEDFEASKEKDFSIYGEAITTQAKMLADLIASGASNEILRMAQLAIEMDFTRWMVDGEVKVTKVEPSLLSYERQSEFSQKVIADFAIFAANYKESAKQFACGSCGNSVMSMFSSAGSVYVPTLASFGLESFFSYKSCPNCSQSISRDSTVCSGCGMSKSEYDSKRSKAA